MYLVRIAVCASVAMQACARYPRLGCEAFTNARRWSVSLDVNEHRVASFRPGAATRTGSLHGSCRSPAWRLSTAPAYPALAPAWAGAGGPGMHWHTGTPVHWQAEHRAAVLPLALRPRPLRQHTALDIVAAAHCQGNITSHSGSLPASDCQSRPSPRTVPYCQASACQPMCWCQWSLSGAALVQHPWYRGTVAR